MLTVAIGTRTVSLRSTRPGRVHRPGGAQDVVPAQSLDAVGLLAQSGPPRCQRDLFAGLAQILGHGGSLRLKFMLAVRSRSNACPAVKAHA